MATMRTRRIRRRAMRDASTTGTTTVVVGRRSTKRHRRRRCGGSYRHRRHPVREGSTGSTADGGEVDAARDPPRGSRTRTTMPCSGHSRYGEDWTTRTTRTSSATRTRGRRGRTGGRRPRGTTTTTTRSRRSAWTCLSRLGAGGWRVRRQRRDALYATNGKWECHEWKCDGGDKFVEDDVPCSIARRPTTMRYSMGWEQSGTTTDARCRHRVLSLSSFSSAAGEEAAAARMGAGGSAAAAVVVVDPAQNAVARRLATRSVHFSSPLSTMDRTSTSCDDDNNGTMGGNDDGRGVDVKNVDGRGSVEDKEGARVAGGTSMDDRRRPSLPRATVVDDDVPAH